MNDRCPTCHRPVTMPHRRVIGGKVVERCVDKSHDGKDFHIYRNEKEFVRRGQEAVRKLELLSLNMRRRGI